MNTEVSQVPTGLRVDAQANRDRILAVAHELFAERGLDVPMAAVARRAGVGVATLYRRFPTRESLVSEVFAEQFGRCASVVQDAVEDPDPWRGFCTVIGEVCAMQAADRGFSAAFLAMLPPELDAEEERERAFAGFAKLTDRAKAAGRLRADFVPEDVILVLMANNGITAEAADVAEAASRRLAAYLIDSFRAERASELPPPAGLSLRDLD
ncbi:TetR/AcrR family transcriptional regulator [Kribbella antibiotica]|uniref:TetR/AcrR family transcriptional regulator n=1 Tax=Kribbella antibiotica TaxID=190195 RepID=A0A4V2YKZ7_9ACTN|nr:TetR/AcrR family transcriptional regulator [Kribbella antibiotica]TDD44747.1 TetR/AcrR family transcriptional regulator [Kribbella antibiotica]